MFARQRKNPHDFRECKKIVNVYGSENIWHKPVGY